MIYNQIVDCFEAAGYPVCSLHGDYGHIAVTTAGARVIACAPSPDSESFLFNPPGISDTESLQKDLFCCDGAPGGDRLWIAPEYAYYWQSEPKDVKHYSNHSVPTGADPGHYQMSAQTDEIALSNKANLHNHSTGTQTSIEVKRIIRPAPTLAGHSGVSSAGYQIDQQLKVRGGIAGLWNIAQLQPGSLMLLPIREKTPPSIYFNKAKTRLTEDALGFYVTGNASAKIGYGSSVSTGRSGALSIQGDQLSLVVRMHPVIENGYYCDALNAGDPKDQVLQAWDGFGFGELEYHSVAAGDTLEQNEVQDTSSFYGFRGEPEQILLLAEEYLELPLSSIRELLPSEWKLNS